MLLYCVLIFLLLILYLVGIKFYKGEGSSDCDRHKEPLGFLYPAILYWLEKMKLLQKNSAKDSMETLRMLYPGENTKKRYLNEMCRKISILYAVLVIISIAGIGLQTASHIQTIENVTLNRPQAGGADASKELTVILQEDGKEVRENTVFHITARQYRKEELMNFKEEAEKKIYEYVKGENTSLESVTKRLNLIKEIQGNPYRISWDVSGQELIDEEGELHNKEISQKAIVTIRACISYKKEEQYLDVLVGVEPYEWSWKEEALQEFYKYVEELDIKSSMDKSFELPSQIGKVKVYYEEKAVDNAKRFFVIGILVCVVLYVYWKQQMKSKKKQYIEECQRCYPSIVSKLALLVGAGMTVKGAWHRMVEDYNKEKGMNQGYYLYAYEEMQITWNEMVSGVTEAEAYNRFGKRMQIRCYMRLCSLITQNLRKGTKGFLVQL